MDQPLPVGIVHNLGRLQQNLSATIICIKAIFGPSEGTGTLERGRLTRAVHDQPLLLCVLSHALPRDGCRLLYRAIDEDPEEDHDGRDVFGDNGTGRMPCLVA